MTKRRSQAGATAALTLMIVGCSSAPSPTPIVEGRDSLGVRVVEFDPSQAERFPEIRLDFPAIRTVGEEEGPSIVLQGVVGGFLADSGVLVLANGGARELLFISPDAGENTAGGSGDGPHEFRAINWIHPFDANSVLAYDHRQRRIQQFSLDSSFERSVSVPEGAPGTIAYPLGPFRDGKILLTRTPILPLREGRSRPLVTIEILDPSDGTVDSVLTTRDSEVVMEAMNRGVAFRNPLLKRETFIVPFGNSILVGDNDMFLVRRYDLAGNEVERLVAAMQAQPLSAGQIEELIEIKYRPISESDRRRQAVTNERARIVHDRPMAFTDLRSDGVDAVWIEIPNLRRNPVTTWIRWIPSRSEIAHLRVDEARTVLDFAARHVVTLRTDAQGREIVEVFGLSNGSSPE